MKKVIKILFFLLVIGFLFFIFIQKHDFLIISQTKTDKIIRYFEIKPIDEFILIFTHSINKRPVYEYIKTHDQQMTIYKARYDAFGAGMPETEEGGLVIAMKEKGIIELTNINRTIDEFSVFVGTVADHKIRIHGKEIPLNTIASPGESLTFSTQKATYFELWKGMI